MKFAHAVVACLLAQAVSGAPVEKDERKLQYGHGYHPPPRTHVPTPRPTPRPTPLPTDRPTPMPTSNPSSRPTPRPTPLPTPMPTHYPTGSPPTKHPTPFPTGLERTHHPTSSPTSHPTRIPTPEPTPEPTPTPSAEPSPEPSPEPSAAPSPEPSSEPSEFPSEDPTSSEEPSESPTASEEPSESPTTSDEPTVPDLDTIAGVICDEANADILGNFCTLIRFTGIDFFLNDFQPLDGVFDDFFDFVQNSPFFPDRRLVEENNNERALLSKPENQGERDLQGATVILPQILDASDFVDLIELVYPGYVGDNPFDSNQFDDWIGDFRNALPPSRQVFTVFAPTNEAFASLPMDVDGIIRAAVAAADVNIALDIVLNHIIAARELLFSQLRCGRQYGMLNAEFTRTECAMEDKMQIGNGNVRANGYPTVVRGLRNTQASNGVIQIVNEVILPVAARPPTNAPSNSPTSSSSPSNSPSVEPMV